MSGDPHATVNTNHCTCPTSWLGIYPPPKCPACQAWEQQWAYPYPTHPWPNGNVGTYTTNNLVFNKLSDEDIEKIAKRVVELLKESK